MNGFFAVAFASLASFGGYIIGGIDSLVLVLFGIVLLDYITGMIASFIEGTLSSKVGLKGIAMKIFIFAVVATAHFIDSLIWENNMLRDATIFFYILNEVISILENAGRAGLPIPTFLVNAVELLKQKVKSKNNSKK
ncbi:MAG: phage holin family protein [Bacillus sp. (in: Bacteria)]|nr:phage holin family protein [Bacillus sp. (in: firmicutes)]